MPRKPPNSNAGLTRRAFTFSVPVAALPLPTGGLTPRLAIDVLWERWRVLRVAIDMPVGDGDDANVEIEEQLYLAMANVIDAPSADLPATIIKLSVLLGMAPIECGQDAEFPWPQIRSMLRALHAAEIHGSSEIALLFFKFHARIAA